MNKTKELIYVLISLLPLWLKMLKVNFIFSKCNILEFYYTQDCGTYVYFHFCLLNFPSIDFIWWWGFFGSPFTITGKSL